jgi:hypothetical protein
VRIDLDRPARAQREPRLCEVETGDLRRAPERAERLFTRENFAILQLCLHARDAVELDMAQRAAAEVATAHALELGDPALGELGVEERERSLRLVDHRDLDAQRGEKRGEFRGDHSAAENDEGLGEVGQPEDRVAVEDVLVIDDDVGRSSRARARRDDDVLGAHDVPRAVGASHA